MTEKRRKYTNYTLGEYRIQIGRDNFATTQSGCDICSSPKQTSFSGARYIGDTYERLSRCSLCTKCSGKHGFFGDDESIKKGIVILIMKDLI